MTTKKIPVTSGIRQVIMSEDEDDLQRMLYKFEKTASKLNMTISVQKTESLTISKEPRRCKLAVYNQSVN
ncbi:hypothetical protein M0804_015332 [Polistes exclamans]|nr:hypothetical protein M0804_015332 [Polistes exclamans]